MSEKLGQADTDWTEGSDPELSQPQTTTTHTSLPTTTVCESDQ